MGVARFRCASVNWLLVEQTDEAREHWRAVRWPYAKQQLLDPTFGLWSSIHAQEFSGYIRATFKPDPRYPEVFDQAVAHYDFFRYGNVGHLIDTRIHSRTDRWPGDDYTGPGGIYTILPSPQRMDRHFVLTENIHLDTGTVWYGASAHFTVGRGPYDGVSGDVWRQRQTKAALDFVDGNADLSRVIFGADINSLYVNDATGPRSIARSRGVGHIRGKVGSDQLRNAAANSYATTNPPPQEGLWADDLLTGTAIEPYYSRLLNAWPSSDHGRLMASVILMYDTPPAPTD